ncbi:MAG TPA: BamA/TamA family outer membrane protein [bacterium]|nr:BamA/TamA family outer membrane protein [bacterium]
MALRRGLVILGCLLLSAASMRAQAQDEVKDGDTAAKEPKELNFAGTPYLYTGPDTGFGVGFSIMFRDLLGKEGRDATFSMDYTQTRYSSFGVSWGEPYFLSENGRASFDIGYDNKPSIRFYGIGNDSRRNKICNWSWVMYNVQPQYIYRWPATDYGTFGLRARVGLTYVNPDDGDLKDKSDRKYYRTIKQVFPDLYDSKEFDPTRLVNVGFTLYLDTREDRFPLGGGREEVVWPLKGTYTEIAYDRFDEGLGSDFSFNRLSVSLTQVLPIYKQDTILVLHQNLQINQGNVPFHQMANYGGGNSLRAFYSYRFIDKNATQFNVELRQGFLPDYELPVLNGLVKLKYPSIVLFWDEARVYHDYEDIADEMFEDYHYTWGFGFRFVVTPTIVIRLERAYSNEQVTFAASASLPF